MTNSKQPVISQDLIQEIPSAIAIVDSNFNFVSASQAWYKMFNLTENEVEQKSILQLFPSFADDLKVRLSYSIDGLNDIKIIQKDPANSNKENNVWNLNPWKDGYGKIIGVTIKVESISKAQELELELNKTKYRLNHKSNIAKIGSWEYNLRAKKLLWTPTVHHIYGVTKDFEPTLEKAYTFYKQGTSRNTIKQVIKEAIATGKPWNETLELVKQDGTKIWVNSIGRPKYSDGVCARIIGTVQDITESISKKTIIQAKPTIQYPLFEKVFFPMALTDLSTGKVIDLNNPFLKLLNISKEAFISKKLSDILGTGFAEKQDKITAELHQKNTYDPIEIEFVKSDKTVISLRIYGSVIKQNDVKTVVHSIQNITISDEKQERLKRTVQSLTEHNEKMLNFAHMVSHNLKSHATNFSLLLNFLKEENGKKERKQLMNMLSNSSDSLANTIKGLREVVAINTSVNEEKRDLNLNEAIFSVEQSVSGLLKKSEGKIINEIPDTTQIKAIPAYLESILTNCISNSIKYKKDNKSPIIILSVEEDDQYVILNIEDNGKGIDMEKYGDKLFGPYRTFHEHKQARGIGLYITKNQIETMNGKISVSSTVNQGSVFKIYFNKK